VPDKNPFRLTFPGGDSPEAHANEFTQRFQCDEPRRNWIRCLFIHMLCFEMSLNLPLALCSPTFRTRRRIRTGRFPADARVRDQNA
jgi:hypothetical protein